MKFLKSKRAFFMWKNLEPYQRIAYKEPEEYPCFVYEVVKSWGEEEEQPIYLYSSDIVNMFSQMEKEKK